MQSLKGQFISALLGVVCLLSAPQVRAELIATTYDTRITYLKPLQNGISALTLVWPIDHPTKDRVSALRAGLSSVASGGTSSRSAHEIYVFLSLKGVRQSVDTSGRNLMLTVSAPNEVFPETLVHLENLLLKSEYSSGWYARELQNASPVNSTITSRPSDVLNEVADFLKYEPADATTGVGDGDFRFGRPTQAILRSGDQEVERRTVRLLKKLPKAKVKWGLPFAKWAKALTGANDNAFALPTGTVHFSDPNATEMLILFVKAEEFESESDQIGTNLLVDYIGASQGSEMFRIIRQEMRAAYNPRARFSVVSKNKAIISLSATAEASNWPEVYEKVSDIYESVRHGSVEQEGLEIQLDILNRIYSDDFFGDPVWGVRQYLHEYPEGTEGDIRLPLFSAFGTVSLSEIVANSKARLPPLEEFLLILIGGGVAPTAAMQSKGYCAIPKNTPLSFCLDVLSDAQY